MLRVNLDGSNKASHGEYSSDSVMGLARLLIAAGYPDQPFECWRGDMKCLTYSSLAWAAAHTIREEPAIRIEKFRKFDAQKIKHGQTGRTDGQTGRTDVQSCTV